MAISSCPECGGKVSTTAKKCVHCGVELKSCPECEAVLLSNIEICPECGYDFSIDNGKENNKENSKNKGKSNNKKNKSKKIEEEEEQIDICKINTLYDTWEEKDNLINYKKKSRMYKAFKISCIVGAILIGVPIALFMVYYFIETGDMVGVLMVSVPVLLPSV